MYRVYFDLNLNKWRRGKKRLPTRSPQPLAVPNTVAWRGYTKRIRVDNGPEFISTTLAEWAEEHSIQLEFIEPGKPTQNSYVERFNRTYRDEILNMYVFKTLNEVRNLTESWLTQYNEERPYDSLNDLTPREYLTKHQNRENSNLDRH